LPSGSTILKSPSIRNEPFFLTVTVVDAIAYAPYDDGNRANLPESLPEMQAEHNAKSAITRIAQQ
jgi:hypothetical protein